VSALSLDPSVSLYEPAAALPAPPARWGQPTAASSRPHSPATHSPTVARHSLERVALSPEGVRRGRRAARPVAPRARRASATSTLSAAVVARTARLVAVRALGTGLAAAAVTFALASKDQGADAASLAALSVRGLAAAAILCAAWGFQDRPRLGTLQTVRTWYGTAVVLGLAHALWIQATMPGAPDAHLAAALSAFALDAVLVATPALLGARAGRPDLRSQLA
jgi:hypothetical protein